MSSDVTCTYVSINLRIALLVNFYIYAILVPAPNTNMRIVSSNVAQRPGQNLTVECQVTIPRGIISTVDVVWSDNGTELDRMNNVTFSPISDSQYQYTDTFTISSLRTSDEGRRIQCLAVINTTPPVNNSGGITLSLTGMYMCVCSLQYCIVDQSI